MILNMVKTLNCLSGRGYFETLLHLKSKIGGLEEIRALAAESRVTYVIALIDITLCCESGGRLRLLNKVIWTR